MYYTKHIGSGFMAQWQLQPFRDAAIRLFEPCSGAGVHLEHIRAW
jgi:hypothetical protein